MQLFGRFLNFHFHLLNDWTWWIYDPCNVMVAVSLSFKSSFMKCTCLLRFCSQALIRLDAEKCQVLEVLFCNFAILHFCNHLTLQWDQFKFGTKFPKGTSHFQTVSAKSLIQFLAVPRGLQEDSLIIPINNTKFV